MKTLSGISQILFNRFYCIFRTLPCVFCTLAIASSVSAQETDNAMLKYGLNFLKTPYVAHTLEVNEEEKLVVNFDEVDCTYLRVTSRKARVELKLETVFPGVCFNT